MPKQSKRRSTAAGKGCMGSGGHENVRAGAGTEPGDDGILTAGALRMLTNKAVSDKLTPTKYAVQTFRKNGPRLQLVELLDIDGPKDCLLSDGECHVQGGFVPDVLPTVRSKACVRYSIIRVTRCVMLQTSSKQFFLLLDRFHVVDRNFGRQVGACDLPLLSSPHIRPADSPHGVCDNMPEEDEGILTPGAIEHIVNRASTVAETSAGNLNHVFDRSTPRLQVVGIESSSGPRTALSLSDGVHIIAGSLYNPTLEEMFRSKAAVVNSTIGVQQCGASVTPGARPVILLVEIKVIDRNFGRMIGNPVTFPSLESVNPTASILSNADRAVSYSDRFEFARRILMQGVDSVGSSTFKAEADRYLKVLKLPRAHTEGFRSIFIMEWCEIVERALDKQASYAPEQLGEEAINDDDLQSSTDLFALIACDDTEQRIVRALGNLARAIPTKCENTLKASHINYLRRFLADANDGITDELPAIFHVGADLNASGYFLYTPTKAFERCIKMARDLLIFGEGPPRGELVSPLDRDGHPLNKDHATAPYYSSFGGGCCDCCGTPAEVGLPHLFKCGRCRLAWYCSSSCQAKSWAEGHHENCKMIARFAEGDTVVLHGLRQRNDLNGSRVQVEKPLPNGRFRVFLE